MSLDLNSGFQRAASALRKGAFGLATAATFSLAAISGAHAEKISPADCQAVRLHFKHHLINYGKDMSREFILAFNSFLKNDCDGMIDGKNIVVPIITLQDDASWRVIHKLQSAGNVDLEVTGLKYDYRRVSATTGAKTEPASRPLSEKRSGLDTVPILVKGN